MVPGMGVQIQHVYMCQGECVNVTELIVVNRPGTSGTLPDFVPLSWMAPIVPEFYFKNNYLSVRSHPLICL